MQQISESAQACIGSLSARPVLILKLNIAETDYYFTSGASDLPYEISGSLLRCTTLEEKVNADLVSGSEKLTVELSDLDRNLLEILNDGILEGASAELWQGFDAAGVDAVFTVFAGVVQQSPQWSQRRLTLSLGGCGGAINKKELLRRTTKEIFPTILPEDQGQTLPLCFGKSVKVAAVRVAAAPQTTLATKFGIDENEFYVTDAENFPEGVITLKVKDELITGSFSGNRFIVSNRGFDIAGGYFGQKCGNAGLVRIADLTGGEGGKFAGLHLFLSSANQQGERRIVDSTADGVLYLDLPFKTDIGSYYQPDENDQGVIFTKIVSHVPGERVTLADETSYYVINDGAVDSVLMVEGNTKKGLVRIPQNRYEVLTADETVFPEAGRPLALIKMYWPPSRINSIDYKSSEFKDDTLTVTLVSADLEGNPVDIIRTVLESTGEIRPELLDDASFTAARVARLGVCMSFALYSSRRVAALLADLCLQARLSLLWQRGRFVLSPLTNGLTQVNRSFSASEVVAISVNDKELAEVVDGIEARYDGGVVCVYRDNSARSNVRTINLWAYQSYEQAHYEAEWWLQRLSASWHNIIVQTCLPAADLERYDVVNLAVEQELGSDYTGIVHGFRRLPLLGAQDVELCELELSVPSWEGCLSSCETACESGACESTGCEMSCTASCELACQSACQLAVQPSAAYWYFGCSTTCQLSCRASTETSCGSGGCESSCEAGCEVSCQGTSFETNCPSGCETAEELGQVIIEDYIEATVTVASSDVAGMVTLADVRSGTVVQALDICDLRPASGSICAAIRSAGGVWYLADAGREAKLVLVQGDLGGGSYTVVESDTSGNTWGASFTASLPG